MTHRIDTGDIVSRMMRISTTTTMLHMGRIIKRVGPFVKVQPMWR